MRGMIKTPKGKKTEKEVMKMSNTVRKNKTVKGSTKKTNKNDLKTNKTLIAAVSASVAAVTLTAAIALTAVLVAPADKKEVNAPAAAAVTYQAPKTQTPAAPEAVKTTTAKTTTNVTKEVAADNNQNKAVAQTTAAQQAAPAAQPQQQAPVSQPETAAQPAAPAETKAQPAAPAAPAETKAQPAAQPAAPAETEAQPAAQPAPAAETKTEKQGTPVIPQGEVNDWKTHDAKDGFPIGTFYDKADTHNTLNVVKLDNTNYKITIVQPTSELSATICNIDAEAHGAKMYYKSAVKTSVVYDTNHSITDSKVIEGTHEGTFDASDAGYTMTDTEGTTVFVPWVGYR